MIKIKVALVGNPNSGKSTIFNNLTGLRQKTSNFPGITVEHKSGSFTYKENIFSVVDLPGTYSLFPNSKDEKLVCEILLNPVNENYPDLVVYVADINNLERHLLLATQILDLNIPLILVLNMIDVFHENKNEINLDILKEKLQVPIIISNAREQESTLSIKEQILESCKTKPYHNETLSFYKFTENETFATVQVNSFLGSENKYQSKLILHHHSWLSFINDEKKLILKSIAEKNGFENIKLQINETMKRFILIQPLVQKAIVNKSSKASESTIRWDNIITHKIFGPIIFFSLMFLIFQSIFSFAEYPMNWIEQAFSFIGEQVRDFLPKAWYSDLLVDGVIAGLSGVLVFIPQIALLFLFLALLEESGYMSRVVYMFDHVMQKFGLNGRSLVALVSSGACAIPAIMSTRTIGNWKERLITMMVAPIIPCSARIPVYTVLISLMIPSEKSFGVLNLQGLTFMALYLLGIITSLVVAFIMKLLIKTDERSYLMMELPLYKKPLWSNVFLEVKDKVMSFITNAGKIILIISVVLWFLASFGPADGIKKAESSAQRYAIENKLTDTESANFIQSKKLESSYAGIIGKFIEPAIQPLGFDWKIGISLLTSFAAREVFVGTMATIYSIGGDAGETSVRERMAQEIRPGTNKKMYDFPTSLSLLIFYAFAMQCMSTLAVTKKETNSWKWPIIQLVYLTTLAYLSSLLVYNLF